MYAVEFHDLRQKERVLFETDDQLSYAWTLYELASQPNRYDVVTGTSLLREDGAGQFTIDRPRITVTA